MASNDTTAPPGGKTLLDDMKPPEGTVLPPRSQRERIEKAAEFISRRGASFEEKMLNDPSKKQLLSFLYPDDPYRGYYDWRVSEFKAGRGNDINASQQAETVTGVSSKGREVRKGPEKPDDFHFSARMPNISAQDLDIVRLTALFVAKNGRAWMTGLSQREAGNFQFDFLRPQHSLYQFFSRLVDQYTELLTGDTVDEGRPQKKRLTELHANVSNRFRVLERAKKRAEYVRWQEAQKVAKEEQEEKEKIAYAQVDWHDFVVVETIVFDERDDEAQLPAPTSLNDLQSASLEQKAAMRVGADRRLEEAMPDFTDYNQYPAYPQPPTPAPPSQMPPPAPTPSNDPNDPNTLAADRERARALHAAAPNPLKVRSDYTPRAAARQAPANTSLCPNCGQAIPNDEIENHMRIEMLDPASRDQHRVAQSRAATTNLSTLDVANNLKRLASQRSDVFDPVTGLAVDGEELKRRKRVELGSYDGVPAPGQGSPGGGAEDRPQNVQEQVRRLHQKYA
ncbi:hypothetical protein B0A50_05497 [Salinomyces thailandicus]|uniref:SURP motif domain-containing protein n=1 Tax=Salinomyces thailandicus TaxID=706561 RepID=A0A4U0TVV2_9PEZI|nr:hypothetical protein B0A50_05497 [Salinomyces thailandica]